MVYMQLVRMRIVADIIDSDTQRAWTDAFPEHVVTFCEVDVSPDDSRLKEAEILSVFVHTPVTAAHIQAMPQLRCIVARSMGFDHIDREAAAARGIVVCSVPAYGVRTVAEFTFALILDLSRKARAAADELKISHTTNVDRFEGFDLAGKTIGIVGTGHIGANVARIARGFAMRILLSDVRQNPDLARETGAPYVLLEELVAQSDIVSLHVPLLPTTHHLCNEALFRRFKLGSILINTARGGIVDTRALLDALKQGRLAGAGLDVVEGEQTLLGTSAQESALAALLTMPNVIITPHIAFDTREAKDEILRISIENIRAFIAGTPRNTIPE